ncbi:MAG TPA: DUF4037 domain-containing protein [Firmicutes bacterium]|nr:DUF4037 domain-containing protein [Bacillota bacterium]
MAVSRPAFLPGLALSESFYRECAAPLLERTFPGLSYSAGLLGYGSDVLGYDDAISTDHMWGPRFYLFLCEEDRPRFPAVWDALCTGLPAEYKGFSVHFSPPDPADHGVRHPEAPAGGRVTPLIFLHTPEEFTRQYLGHGPDEALSCADWLSMSEHRLLAFTSGKLFRDDLGIAAIQERFRFYPDTVRDYLIASQWSLIAEEQAFPRRCADRGDVLGSRLIAARIVERLMRLCFLYQGRYAPYSKWLGTAFRRLPHDPDLPAALEKAVEAPSSEEREKAMIRAQILVADQHNRSGLPPVDAVPQSYFGRPIQVIWADRFAQAAAQSLRGTPLEGAPLIGTMSQIGNFCALSDRNEYAARIRGLYGPGRHAE